MRFSFKFTRSQIYLCVCATLYLIGAVLMLVNTFSGADGVFWVGLVVAIGATVFYVLMIFEDKKKVSYSVEKENSNRHEYIEKKTDITTTGSSSGSASNLGSSPTSGVKSQNSKGTKSAKNTQSGGTKKTVTKK